MKAPRGIRTVTARRIISSSPPNPLNGEMIRPLSAVNGRGVLMKQRRRNQQLDLAMGSVVALGLWPAKATFLRYRR